MYVLKPPQQFVRNTRVLSEADYENGKQRHEISRQELNEPRVDAGLLDLARAQTTEVR